MDNFPRIMIQDGIRPEHESLNIQKRIEHVAALASDHLSCSSIKCPTEVAEHKSVFTLKSQDPHHASCYHALKKGRWYILQSQFLLIFFSEHN